MVLQKHKVALILNLVFIILQTIFRKYQSYDELLSITKNFKNHHTSHIIQTHYHGSIILSRYKKLNNLEIYSFEFLF